MMIRSYFDYVSPDAYLGATQIRAIGQNVLDPERIARWRAVTPTAVRSLCLAIGGRRLDTTEPLVSHGQADTSATG